MTQANDMEGDMTQNFGKVNRRIRKERRKVMRRMKKKYDELTKESRRRRDQQKEYKEQIAGLKQQFKEFQYDMKIQLQKTRENAMMKKLSEIQAKTADRKMKKRALKFVKKMAKKLGKKNGEGSEDGKDLKKMKKKIKKLEKKAKGDSPSSSDDVSDVRKYIRDAAKDSLDSAFSKSLDGNTDLGGVFNYFKSPDKPKPNLSDAPYGHPLKNERNDGESMRKLQRAMAKKEAHIAKQTARFMTGKFIKHECHQKMSVCKRRMKKHFEVLKKCEKDKDGEDATCWKDVSRMSKKIMKNHEHCRRLERTCNADISQKELDRMNPFGQKGKGSGMGGFMDELTDDVHSMEHDALNGHGGKHGKHGGKHGKGKHGKKKKRTKRKRPQVIIKGGVQHFHMPGPDGASDSQSGPDGSGKGSKKSKSDREKAKKEKEKKDEYMTDPTLNLMPSGPSKSIKLFGDDDDFAMLQDDLYYSRANDASDDSKSFEFFEDSRERHPRDSEKPYGYHVDQSLKRRNRVDDTGNTNANQARTVDQEDPSLVDQGGSWLGKKYNQLKAFFG